MSYDHSNIFARMLRGEVPARVVFENDYVFSFYDIFPRAPVHVLVIPKGAYMNAYDFQTHASADEIVGFYRGVSQTIDLLGVKDSGFRLVSNTGVHAHQEVPHFHVHILGGAILDSLPTL